MPTTYERCNQEFGNLVEEVMDNYHGGLSDAEVTVDVLLAHAALDKNGDPTGRPIKVNGYPAAAKIRITNLRERVLGHADAEMIVDGDILDEWSVEQREALIDHELSHLECAGERDDVGRPKLKIIPHDFMIGGFESVVRRHGEESLEVQQLKRLLDDEMSRQMYLPFAEEVPA